MKKILVFVCLFLMTQISYAEKNNLEGYIIYANENSLRVLNLSKKTDKILYKFSPNVAGLNSLSKISKDKIMLVVGYRTVGNFICEFNLKTMKLTRLTKGSDPVLFIQKYNGYYYFST